MFTNEYGVYYVNQCVSLGVTYRSMGRKISLETWMTQSQLHQQKVHPCLGKSSPEQHPWSSLQDLRAASHAGKSPTGRLVIWKSLHSATTQASLNWVALVKGLMHLAARFPDCGHLFTSWVSWAYPLPPRGGVSVGGKCCSGVYRLSSPGCTTPNNW